LQEREGLLELASTIKEMTKLSEDAAIRVEGLGEELSMCKKELDAARCELESEQKKGEVKARALAHGELELKKLRYERDEAVAERDVQIAAASNLRDQLRDAQHRLGANQKDAEEVKQEHEERMKRLTASLDATAREVRPVAFMAISEEHMMYGPE
jgi:chromosome segregation ATPase